MNSYEERQEARREHYLELAQKARAESSHRWETAHNMSKAIPFGQPILVGHYSEKSDRAYRKRMAGHYDKALELSGKADYYEEKAANVGKGGISSDDPDAIVKLSAKLERLKKAQEDMKATNRAIRLKDIEKGNDRLREQGYSDEQIAELRKPDFCGRIGYPNYMLSNNNANIHRIEERIKELQQRRNRDNEASHIQTELYEYRIEDNRCQFIFNGKPIEEVRHILKSHSFKWSPTRGAWVRQASGNGIYASNIVRKELDSLAEQEHS